MSSSMLLGLCLAGVSVAVGGDLRFRLLHNSSPIADRSLFALAEYRTATEYVTRVLEVSDGGLVAMDAVEDGGGDIKVSAVGLGGEVLYAGYVSVPQDTALTPVELMKLPSSSVRMITPSPEEAELSSGSPRPVVAASVEQLYGLRIRQVSYGEVRSPFISNAEAGLRSPAYIARSQVYGLPIPVGARISSSRDSRGTRETYSVRIFSLSVDYVFSIDEVVDPRAPGISVISVAEKPVRVASSVGLEGFTSKFGRDFLLIEGRVGAFNIQGYALMKGFAGPSREMDVMERHLVAVLKVLIQGPQ